MYLYKKTIIWLKTKNDKRVSFGNVLFLKVTQKNVRTVTFMVRSTTVSFFIFFREEVNTPTPLFVACLLSVIGTIYNKHYARKGKYNTDVLSNISGLI